MDNSANEAQGPTTAARRAAVGEHAYLNLTAGEADARLPQQHQEQRLLPHGETCTLPFINTGSALIVPGAKLPLHIVNWGELATLRSALLAPLPYRNLLCTAVKHAATEQDGAVVGCIVEIVKLSTSDQNLRCIAEGRQRCWVRLAGPRAFPSFPEVTALQDKPLARVPRAALANATWWPPWLWKRHDAWLLAEQVTQLMERLQPGTRVPRTDSPTELGYWLVRQIPCNIVQRQALLEERHATSRLQLAVRLLAGLAAVRCGSCSTVVADVLDAVEMTEDGPSGVFVNSYGFVHDLLCVLRARNSTPSSRPTLLHTWFPGYTWSILHCAGTTRQGGGPCLEHLGWLFEATEADQQPTSFVGLRRDVIHLSTAVPQAPRPEGIG